MSRHNLRNTALLEQLVHFLADVLGSPVTAQRISDFLKSQRIKSAPKVILDYSKYVISMDPMAGEERDGIQHLPLREFLLQAER